MRFIVAAAAAGLVGIAAAQNSTASEVYVTDIVTAYTTYCPEATLLTYASQTYTVSEATTLTITNCPGGCTITKPVSASAVAPVAASSAAVLTSASPVTAMSTASAAPYPSINGTAPVAASGTGVAAASGTGSGSSATSTSSIVPHIGAASKSYAGLGFLAVLGLAAAL